LPDPAPIPSARHDSTATKSRFWETVDAVLVINLDHRTDRWESFVATSAAVIPAAKLVRISAVLGASLPGYGEKPWFRGRKRDTTWAARAGCTLSHRRAMETARRHGWRRVLVLEDDVDLQGAFPDSLGAVLADPAAEWQVAYLGYTDPLGPFATITEPAPGTAVARVFGCNCAHAYLVNAAARDWLLDRLPEPPDIWRWLARHRAVDRFYMRNLGRHFRVWAVSPSWINQSAGFSDIVGKHTDYVESGAHRLSVPAGVNAAAWRYPARALALSLAGLGDRLRGIAKRLRGF